MKSFTTLIIIMLSGYLNAQTNAIDYFGQTPPGDSSVIFSPDFISTDNRFVQSSSFSMDGSEFCFAETNSEWSSLKIMYTEYENDHWSDPAYLYFLGDEINKNENLGPCFSPDSNRFYLNESFKSLWYSERDGQVWSEPIKVPDPISSSEGVGEVSISKRNTLFFARKGSVYYSELQAGSYSQITIIENPVNTIGSTDIDPYISPDEDYFIFSSNRSDTYGSFDLYISYKKTDGKWTNPKNLGPKINTEEWECVPSVTPDGKYLLFTRREGGGVDGINAKSSKIYWVDTTFIDLLKLTNYDPYVLNTIPNQTDTIGNFYTYTIPDTIFYDDDGNETLTLTASLNDNIDLPDSLTFDSATNTISGKLKEAGSYNIKISAIDLSGAYVSDIFKLTVEQGTTAINDIDANDNLVVFPNPANQTIQIKIGEFISDNIGYEIMDLSGKVIKQGRLESEIIDISDINKGIYLIQLKTDKEIISKKIVIE